MAAKKTTSNKAATEKKTSEVKKTATKKQTTKAATDKAPAKKTTKAATTEKKPVAEKKATANKANTEKKTATAKKETEAKATPKKTEEKKTTKAKKPAPKKQTTSKPKAQTKVEPAVDEKPTVEEKTLVEEKVVEKKEKTPKKVIAKRIVAWLGVALLLLVITLIFACLVICYGPSTSLRDQAVLSAKEASATKWLPGLFLPDKVIDQIIEESQEQQVATIKASSLDTASEDEWSDAIDGMKLIFKDYPNFKAYILLVRDPSRVIAGVSAENYGDSGSGITIYEALEKYGAVAATNGGEFEDDGGKGSGWAPYGLTYSQGECKWNDGLRKTFVGFTDDNELISINGLTKEEAEELGVRDGMCFRESNTLIDHDGDNVNCYYQNSDLSTAQRTAIGQRADGTVIILVTDGRSAESIGATKNDLIDVFLEFGAVTAGMVDGGSSSTLYYPGYAEKYNLDTSGFDSYQLGGFVNRFKAFIPPRDIPTFWIVLPEEEAES